MMKKFPLGNQFKQKLDNQWKIENSGNEQLAPDNQQPALRHLPSKKKKNNNNVIFFKVFKLKEIYAKSS